MNAQELGNRPAFPTERVVSGYGTTVLVGGITCRQWLAGMAMQGILANPHTAGESYDAIARRSLNQADAILAREAQEAGDAQ